MARLGGHPVQPAPDRGIAGEVETALIGAMGVAIERDVGDRVAPAGEPVMGLQMGLHDAQRGIALRVPFGHQMALFGQRLGSRE